MTETIQASEGMILTNGKIYGRIIRLANNIDASEFYEITEEKYNTIMKELEDQLMEER